MSDKTSLISRYPLRYPGVSQPPPEQSRSPAYEDNDCDAVATGQGPRIGIVVDLVEDGKRFGRENTQWNVTNRGRWKGDHR